MLGVLLHQIASVLQRETSLLHSHSHTFNLHAHLISTLGQLHTQAATCRRLSNTSFATHKDPLQRLLVNDVLQRGFRKIGIINFGIRSHSCNKLVYSKQTVSIVAEDIGIVAVAILVGRFTRSGVTLDRQRPKTKDQRRT
jgi:hypothetical protein